MYAVAAHGRHAASMYACITTRRTQHGVLLHTGYARATAAWPPFATSHGSIVSLAHRPRPSHGSMASLTTTPTRTSRGSLASLSTTPLRTSHAYMASLTLHRDEPRRMASLTTSRRVEPRSTASTTRHQDEPRSMAPMIPHIYAKGSQHLAHIITQLLNYSITLRSPPPRPARWLSRSMSGVPRPVAGSQPATAAHPAPATLGAAAPL